MHWKILRTLSLVNEISVLHTGLTNISSAPNCCLSRMDCLQPSGKSSAHVFKGASLLTENHVHTHPLAGWRHGRFALGTCPIWLASSFCLLHQNPCLALHFEGHLVWVALSRHQQSSSVTGHLLGIAPEFGWLGKTQAQCVLAQQLWEPCREFGVTTLADTQLLPVSCPYYQWILWVVRTDVPPCSTWCPFRPPAASLVALEI